MNAITTIDADEVKTLAAITPMEMLGRAVSSGASIETLTKLMELQERHEANQARKAFDQAISEAKAEIPLIAHNATGHNSKRYANFAAYAKAVDPILSKHGLSYRFATEQADRISVTCIVSHRDGHSERNTLSALADKSGSKNDIQAIGSTLTYLQRYSLAQALGLAASGDDDGQAAGGKDTSLITQDQVSEIRKRIEDTGSDIAIFCKTFGVNAIPEIMQCDYGTAIAKLETKAKLNKDRAAK